MPRSPPPPPSNSTVINARTITAVPLTTRNFTQIVSMSSGSASDVNNAGSLGRGTRSVNVNGNTSAGGYTLDGAFAPSAVPNPDTISVLKVQNSQYDAVYGAQVPSTALITKSGENEFHGDAWEFVRNDIFNANSFFRNSTGQPKPNLKQNQYRRHPRRAGPQQEAVLFRLLPGHPAGQRAGHHIHLEPHPAAADGRPFRGDAGRASSVPANHPATRATSRFAGGKQLDCRNQTTATTAPINPVALAMLQLKNPDGSYLVPVPQTILTRAPTPASDSPPTASPPLITRITIC